MEETYYHTVELDGLFEKLVRCAVSNALYQMFSLDTDFSIKLYHSNILDLNELISFREKVIAHIGKTIGMSEQELTLLYICHYIFVCLAEDKEAFYKWFLTFEERATHVDDSNDFRIVTRDAHADMVKVIEASTLWTDDMQAKKEQLEKIISIKGEG